MSHDELAKADWKDHDRIKQMVDSYTRRYDQYFWNAVQKMTENQSGKIVADFGCGPGLFLIDVARIYDAEKVIGLDESSEMLEYARNLFAERLAPVSFELVQIDFDSTMIPIETRTIDFAFCGFMLHEVRDPQDFVHQIVNTLTPTGFYVIYDYVSGNVDAFVQAMMERGMDEQHARKRYPHMCRHSIDDITKLMKNAGLRDINAIGVNDIRAVVFGKK